MTAYQIFVDSSDVSLNSSLLQVCLFFFPYQVFLIFRMSIHFTFLNCRPWINSGDQCLICCLETSVWCGNIWSARIEREDFFFCPECDLSNNESSNQLNENSCDFLKSSWVSLSVPQSLKFWQSSGCHKTKNTINGGVSFVLINVPKVFQSLTISSFLRPKYFIAMGCSLLCAG